MNYVKMRRETVTSSVIYAIGYSVKQHLLEVELRSHEVYHYYDVTEEDYQNFMQATSKGQYYNFYIKPFYEYRQVKKSA